MKLLRKERKISKAIKKGRGERWRSDTEGGCGAGRAESNCSRERRDEGVIMGARG